MARRQPNVHSPARRQARLARAFRHACSLVDQVCETVGDRALVTDVRAEFGENGVAAAVQRHDDGPIYDWLVGALSYQGISDQVARSYWAGGGGVTYAQVTRGLAKGRCPKLRSFWTFEGCGYRKGAQSCSRPDDRPTCPLPRHDLRNGRLNQLAYSLRLFLRDAVADDLVSWIDRRLAQADLPLGEDRVLRLGAAVIDPLKGVFGVLDKVLAMAFSELFIGADPDRRLWITAGAGMIAIDTLVHNWFHRTGLLVALDAQHPYGTGCYGPTGCASLLRRISTEIDARRFHPDYPRDFPRFIQKAVWRFCALDHDGRCNGVRINDRKGCDDPDCPLGPSCARMPITTPTDRTPDSGRTP